MASKKASFEQGFSLLLRASVLSFFRKVGRTNSTTTTVEESKKNRRPFLDPLTRPIAGAPPRAPIAAIPGLRSSKIVAVRAQEARGGKEEEKN